MTNGKPSTYYQPELYYDDGTNIGWELPEGLFSFQAFPSREECETTAMSPGSASSTSTTGTTSRA